VSPIRTPYESSDPGDERWQESANCVGKTHELFEYQEEDSPSALGLSFGQRIEMNKTNFELASEVCIECPVMLTCLSSSTEDERTWTVRGGEIPLRFLSELKTYEQIQAYQFAVRAGPLCQRGHPMPPDGGRCKTCKRERQTEWQRNQRARKRAEGVS